MMLTPKVIELHYLHILFFELNLDTISIYKPKFIVYCQNVCTGEAVIYILLLLKLSVILTPELINSQSHQYLSVEECVMAHRYEYFTV
jgi:hypothetical protein